MIQDSPQENNQVPFGIRTGISLGESDHQIREPPNFLACEIQSAINPPMHSSSNPFRLL